LMAHRPAGRVALIVVAILLTVIAAAAAWFWIGSSRAVGDVREMEDLAIRVIRDLRLPELELQRGPTRMAERDVRLAWALSKVGDPELLGMLLVDDLYWRPGRGVGISMLFRSPMDIRETCLRLRDHVERPSTNCPDSPEGPESEEWLVPIEGESVAGEARIFRQLRTPLGTKREYVILVEFDVEACGTVRTQASDPCQ
jgi:hypothetical protein